MLNYPTYATELALIAATPRTGAPIAFQAKVKYSRIRPRRRKDWRLLGCIHVLFDAGLQLAVAQPVKR
jgi:hypothetical protein